MSTTPKQKYSAHKSEAKRRGIPFELTFDEWNNWWLSNGVDKRFATTHCPTQPVMSRFKDQGPYSLDNIYLNTRSSNTKEGWIHRDHSFKLKKISTPVGIFSSRKEAANYYKINPTNINYWIKTKESFYYIG